MMTANRYAMAAATLQNIPTDVVATDELAAYLRCHRDTIERMVKRGILKPIRVGRCWRFDKQQVLQILASRSA